jgi:hypothetical protein
MKRLALFVLAATAALVTCGLSRAAERIGAFTISDSMPEAIVLTGEFDSRTPGDFRRALAAQPKAKVLILGSPGGVVASALKVSSLVQSRGMSTAIPSGFGCYSACVYVFFAGREHVVRGELGVHRMSTGFGSANDASGAAAYYAQVSSELSRYDIPDGVIERMLATPPDSMHVFSKNEIASLSINRGSPKSLAARFAAR